MSGSTSTLTIGGLITEARALLQDTMQGNASSPVQDEPMYRYSDVDMIAAFNGAMLETRAKRPRYYLQNFHFQSGGWMTEDSAKRYDTATTCVLTCSRL